MASVFLVQHVHEQGDGTEDVKLIGAYSSRVKAEAAVSRLSHQPGFCDTPDGFHVEEYRIDADHWVEGYVTVGSV